MEDARKPALRLGLRWKLFIAASIGLLPILPRQIHQVLAVIAALSIGMIVCFSVVAGIMAVLVVCHHLLFCLVDRRPPVRRVAWRFQFRLRSLLAVVTVSAVAMFGALNVHPLDWFLGVALNEDTIYSPQYTAVGWWRVQPGMARNEVQRLLGPPLREQGETWEYTRYGPSENYHRREVRFANGVVVEKVAELYVD
ncbi:MAG TPA: hypothetical protein VF306_17740 [Pirellulales bacterium]